MIFLLDVIIIFIASILSVTVTPYISIFGFTPDILFIVILIFSIIKNYKRFIFYNFFAALLYALLSNLPMTAALPAFFIPTSLSNILFRYYIGESNTIIIAMYAVMASMLFKMTEISLLYIENYALLASLLNAQTIKLVAGQIIYNMFLTILIFQILKKIKIKIVFTEQLI